LLLLTTLFESWNKSRSVSFSDERIRKIFQQWFYTVILKKYPAKLKIDHVISKYLSSTLAQYSSIQNDKMILKDLDSTKILNIVANINRHQKELERTLSKNEFNLFKERSDELKKQLNKESISSIFPVITTCPSCNNSSSNNIDYRNNFEVEVKCNKSNCSTTWGIKFCKICEIRIPYQKISKFNQIIHKIGISNNTYTEEVFGSDLLANFSLDDKNDVKWICPNCNCIIE